MTEPYLRYLIGDVFDRLAEIPDGSIDLIVSSPPFLALRSYLPADHPNKGKEIGQEPTPADFIRTHLELAGEYARVLAPHGSLCYEIGDTYSGSGGAGGDYNACGMREGQPKLRQHTGSDQKGSARYPNGRGQGNGGLVMNGGPGWPLSKSMCIVPHMFCGSLVYGWNMLDPAAGPSPAGRWRVRNVICWARNNPPVGALGDKFRPATSFIIVACKSGSRFFDIEAVKLPLADSPGNRYVRNVSARDAERRISGSSTDNRITKAYDPTVSSGAPPKDWHADGHPEDGDWLWQLNTQPYSGAHFATFPMELPKRMITAMCPQRVCTTCGVPSKRITERTPEYAAIREAVGDFNQRDRSTGAISGNRSEQLGTLTSAENVTTGWTDCGHDTWRTGIVLDPFGGSGTTAEAAQAVGRSAVLIDIDERNANLAQERVGMFLEIDGAP